VERRGDAYLSLLVETMPEGLRLYMERESSRICSVGQCSHQQCIRKSAIRPNDTKTDGSLERWALSMHSEMARGHGCCRTFASRRADDARVTISKSLSLVSKSYFLAPLLLIFVLLINRFRHHCLAADCQSLQSGSYLTFFFCFDRRGETRDGTSFESPPCRSAFSIVQLLSSQRARFRRMSL
jgi:hypothetical protein